MPGGTPRPVSQYSYEGEEHGDTELDFSVVWDGGFPIDKPPGFRGEGCQRAKESVSQGRGAALTPHAC